jgi:plastocyanin
MKKIFFILSVFILIGTSLEVYAKTHKIYMDSMSYDPDHLEVKVGDKITWINRDISVHSATSTHYAFNSGSIRRKKRWSFKVKEEGEYPYKCLFHSGMKGSFTATK